MRPNDVSFRDRIATVDPEGKRKWIFAQKPKGRFSSARTWASRVFFLVFLSLPFIKYKDRPLFLFNIPEAKFIIFGKIFWPQDFFIFGLTMVTFIIIIVLFTAAFGRLFCGWICPQTIFMEMVFRKIEYLIEGDASKQRVLAKMSWNTEKISKKAGKHTVFFGVAFIIANYFLAYIIGVDKLWQIITEPVSQHWVGFLSLIVFSSVFYLVYAFFREQACTVVCPYGRLQSVLLDRNSMIVAYDYQRGEPRGKLKKGEGSESFGDCIDCFNCVRVCPTGIDIRNGLQMECVGCTACIDACDQIMESINKPRGLVRYDSENGISLQKPLRYTARMKFYTFILIVLSGLLALLLATRAAIDGTIVRTRGQLYQEVGVDSLSNLYEIKIINKTMKDKDVTLKLEGEFEHSGRVSMIGNNFIHLKREDQAAGSFFITISKKALSQRTVKLKVGLYSGKEKITTIKTNFTGPFTKGE